MTPEQRDELVTMAGAVVEEDRFYENSGDGWCIRRYVFPDKTQINVHDFHPETSRDDCQPLFAEIERRGLQRNFMHNLFEICTNQQAIPIDISVMMDIAWWAIAKLQPADIVAAFRKTIEEDARKKGE